MDKQLLNNVEAIFLEIFIEELHQCDVGCIINLWTRIDTDFINAYRQGTVGGRGKVAILSKLENPAITELLCAGHPVWLVVTERNSKELAFSINTDRNKTRAL